MKPPTIRQAVRGREFQGCVRSGYLRSLTLNPKTAPDRVGADLKEAIDCLVRLQRIDEVDEFREAVVVVHAGNWRLLQAAAESYLDDAHHGGCIVAGKFERGHDRIGARYVLASQRDRSRALQLLVQGLDRARSDPDCAAAGLYLMTLARALMDGQDTDRSWRLQNLTPLDILADYDGNDGYRQSRAPVEPDGTPVFYRVPESFPKAKNDGERWRWALAQAALLDAGLLNTGRCVLAGFLVGEFGTRQFDVTQIAGESVQVRSGASSPNAAATLADDETIAGLATGVKRFKLPDEFNPIKIYQAIAVGPKSGHGEEALDNLATIFENRGQLGRAAGYLKRSREVYGEKGDRAKTQRLNQILGAWGEFEGTRPQPAGRGASVDFRFRNGRRVRFEAHEILVEKLLKDVKEYISSRPQPLDLDKLDFDDIGTRLVARSEHQYLGRPIAGWDLDLAPSPGHFDKRITVTTPLQTAGAYLLTGRMEGGNISRIVVWLDDTIIIQKSLSDRAYYFVADARTGQPIPRADVELFRWRVLRLEGKNQAPFETKVSSLRTDDEGQFQVPATDLVDGNAFYQGLITARTKQGRFAHLGFPRDEWGFGVHTQAYNEVKVFAITDRPVYRPGSPVRFKFWAARARYDQPGQSEFAGRSFPVEIRNPKGDRIFAKEFTADSFGGFDGSFELPSDAMLGSYYAVVHSKGRQGRFLRVPWSRSAVAPEFEVLVDTPTRPVMLGEKVPATISAKYYFGGAVAQAKVKYKITRFPAVEQWYPTGRWDWLFGPGHWWFASDSAWYPGWSRWGIAQPVPWWERRAGGGVEGVAVAELPIRPDGTLPVEIDTAPAKAAHPDQDQSYFISAEITDQSRRTIVGSGTVQVARKPFSVYTWVDRGHYRAGDTIEAGICAQTLDHKPIAGKGTLKLLKIAFDAQQKPIETPVESWDLKLGPDGQARQSIKASAAGHFRLSAMIDDGQGHVIEGGYLLTITGQGYDGASFRFNDLEIIPDRKEYRPGDTLRLMINTNQINSTVLLFVRPTDTVYQLPRVLRLRGKSRIEEIGIVAGDRPNIFVEALTVADGKVHHAVREIAVPPESRIVDIAIEPSQKTFKPGQKARVKLKLTQGSSGPGGTQPVPFVGSTVVAVYDKSIEFISGGANFTRIEEFFWKWTRFHAACTDSSFDRWFANELKAGEVPMQFLNTYLRPVAHRNAFADGKSTMPRQRMAQKGMTDLGGTVKLSYMLLPTAEHVWPVIRSKFADTAFWIAALDTAPDGTAEVEFTLPESLTTWKVKAWTMGLGTKVGQAETEIVTTKDLLVRLQAPRFFVEKDEVVLSAIVHNKLKTRKAVQVVLEFEGSVLQALGETTQSVEIAAGSERRVDWLVKVAHEGQAVIRMKALTDEESDGAQMSFPAYVHGMLKTEARRRAVAVPGGKGLADQQQGAGRPERNQVLGRAQARAIAARGAVFPHAGRRAGRRPPLPRRLPLRLHRADLEPLPADGHYPEVADQPGARPEGHPGQAHQLERSAAR